MIKTKTKPDAQARALEIKATAEKLGFTVEARGSILTVKKTFLAGDKDAFCVADTDYGSVFDLLPRTSPGSDWGTDGGTIGGMVAIKNGLFVMNRSGGSKSVLNALAKILARKGPHVC